MKIDANLGFAKHCYCELTHPIPMRSGALPWARGDDAVNACLDEETSAARANWLAKNIGGAAFRCPAGDKDRVLLSVNDHLVFLVLIAQPLSQVLDIYRQPVKPQCNDPAPLISDHGAYLRVRIL